MLEQFSINNYVITLPSIQRKDMSSKSICGRKEYWADFHNFHHCPCLTVLHLTIWDFVHEVNLTYEFFEIINKRNIVSDYENEMYSFVFV